MRIREVAPLCSFHCLPALALTLAVGIQQGLGVSDGRFARCLRFWQQCCMWAMPAPTLFAWAVGCLALLPVAGRGSILEPIRPPQNWGIRIVPEKTVRFSFQAGWLPCCSMQQPQRPQSELAIVRISAFCGLPEHGDALCIIAGLCY
jgi:hypothetical protein